MFYIHLTYSVMANSIILPSKLDDDMRSTYMRVYMVDQVKEEGYNLVGTTTFEPAQILGLICPPPCFHFHPVLLSTVYYQITTKMSRRI